MQLSDSHITISSATFALLLHAIASHAQTENSLISEQEFFSDIPSVESVTRLPQLKSETPATVTIIDSDMLKASGVRNIADIFRLVPGFQVAYPHSHRPAVTYHGMGDEFTRRMQILIDGRSVYGALFGHVSWSSLAIAIEDIDRIEIVRGPNTVTYGANAFLGTINIITRHAAQHRGTFTKLTVGDHDIRDALVRYGGDYNNVEYRLSAGYSSDNGLRNLPDDNRSTFLNLRSDFQLNNRDTLMLQIGYSYGKPQEGFLNNPEFPPTTTTVNAHFEHIHWRRYLSGNNELSMQFYHNRRAIDYSYLTDPITVDNVPSAIQVPVSLSDTTGRYDLELQHTLTPTKNNRFVWGIGMRVDKVDSNSFLYDDTQVKTESARIFTNSEWRISPSFITNVGAMWEYTDFTGSDVSPRIALNYHINNNHTVRSVWSKARRIPSLFEEKGNIQIYYEDFLIEHQYVSRGGLKTESMDSFELGYLGQLRALKATLDIRAYHDRINNVITQIRVPAEDFSDDIAIDHINAGAVTVNGIDLELSFNIRRHSRVTFTFARMNSSGSGIPQDAVTNHRQRLRSIPDYSASLFATHQFANHWSASISQSWVDDMYWLSDGDFLEDYNRTDIRVARRMRFGNLNGEIALTAQNIGKDYEDFARQQYFDRRVFVTVNFNI